MSDLIPKNIWKELVLVAEKDEFISKDEIILMENIRKNLQHYYSSIQKQNKNKTKTDEDELKIFGIQLDILRNAYDTAYADGIISEDEYELLKKLQIIVRKIAEEHDT